MFIIKQLNVVKHEQVIIQLNTRHNRMHCKRYADFKLIYLNVTQLNVVKYE